MRQRLHLIRASFNRSFFRIDLHIRVMRFDQADVFEDELVGARGRQLPLAEEHADFRSGANDVVRVDLHNDRHVMRSPAFVGHVFHRHLVVADASPLVDRALDAVFGHAFLLRFLNGGEKSRVHQRVGPAAPGSERDFADQFGIGPALFLAGDQTFCV